jgi:hypothetical protein
VSYAPTKPEADGEDVFQIAHDLIEECGDLATMESVRRANASFLSYDYDGVSHWRRVCDAIKVICQNRGQEYRG